MGHAGWCPTIRRLGHPPLLDRERLMLPTTRAGVAAAITLTMTLATGSSPALADHFQPGGSAVPNGVPRPTAVTATSPLRVVAAAAPQLDITGTTWLPDGAYAYGGTLTSTTQ